jgi:hypothetical protein
MKIPKFLILLIAIQLLFLTKSNAQLSIRDSVETVWMINGGVAYHQPLGILNERYGRSPNIEIGFAYKNKKNIFFGIGGGLFYSNTINENNLLENLTNSNGYIIGDNGTPIEIVFTERGLLFSAYVGSILPIHIYNKNSGIFWQFGAGYMQHKIRFDVKAGSYNRFDKPYNKGYDRLCSGLQLHQQVGFMFLHNKKKVNFKVGLDFHEGFTKSRRTIDYDTGLYDNRNRIDVLIGPFFTWILPVYNKVERKIYYR